MNEPAGQSLYRLDVAVRWGEMDALGHVNNAVYFRWFEQVRIEWYESLGRPPLALPGVASDPSARSTTSPGASDAAAVEQGEGLSGSMVIVDNRAEYLLPVVYPSQLVVRMAGHSPGRSSFVSTYTIHVGDQLMTRGQSKIVWIDPASGRSMPLPEKVRQLLGGTVRV